MRGALPLGTQMNWRDEYAKSLMTLGNLALVGLVFNGILNPDARWWHFVMGGFVLWDVALDKLANRTW
jgi:hypothetical protein